MTVHLDALNRYKKTKAHSVDCLIAATAVAKNAPVVTFDQDFRKFIDVRVETEVVASELPPLFFRSARSPWGRLGCSSLPLAMRGPSLQSG